MPEGGAAYQKLQVPQDGLSQAMQYWGGIKAKENAEEKLAKERAAVRNQERIDKFWEGLPKGDFDIPLTGDNSYDDIITMYASNKTEQIGQLNEKAMERYEAGDMKGARAYELKARQAEQSFKSIAGLTEGVQTKVKENLENMEGKNPYDKRYKVFEAIAQNRYLLSEDKNGRPIILVGLDRDGDGTISTEERQKANDYIRDGAQEDNLEYEIVSVNDLIKGFYDQYDKVNISKDDGLIDQLASGIGIATKDEQTGLYMKTTSGFDETKLENLQNNAKQLLNSSKQTLAWVMNSALGIGIEEGKERVDGFTDAEKKQAVDYLVKQTIAKYPVTNSEQFMSGLAADTRARQKEGKEGAKNKVGISLMTAKKGGLNIIRQEVTGTGKETKTTDKSGYNFALKTGDNKTITGMSELDAEAELLAMRIEDGELMLQFRSDAPEDMFAMSYPTDKSKTQWKYPTDTEANNVAERLGLGGAAELIKHLNQTIAEEEKKQKPDNNVEVPSTNKAPATNQKSR